MRFLSTVLLAVHAVTVCIPTATAENVLPSFVSSHVPVPTAALSAFVTTGSQASATVVMAGEVYSPQLGAAGTMRNHRTSTNDTEFTLATALLQAQQPVHLQNVTGSVLPTSLLHQLQHNQAEQQQAAEQAWNHISNQTYGRLQDANTHIQRQHSDNSDYFNTLFSDVENAMAAFDSPSTLTTNINQLIPQVQLCSVRTGCVTTYDTPYLQMNSYANQLQTLLGQAELLLDQTAAVDSHMQLQISVLQQSRDQQASQTAYALHNLIQQLRSASSLASNIYARLSRDNITCIMLHNEISGAQISQQQAIDSGNSALSEVYANMSTTLLANVTVCRQSVQLLQPEVDAQNSFINEISANISKIVNSMPGNQRNIIQQAVALNDKTIQVQNIIDQINQTLLQIQGYTDQVNTSEIFSNQDFLTQFANLTYFYGVQLNQSAVAVQNISINSVATENNMVQQLLCNTSFSNGVGTGLMGNLSAVVLQNTYASGVLSSAHASGFTKHVWFSLGDSDRDNIVHLLSSNETAYPYAHYLAVTNQTLACGVMNNNNTFVTASSSNSSVPIVPNMRYRAACVYDPVAAELQLYRWDIDQNGYVVHFGVYVQQLETEDVLQVQAISMQVGAMGSFVPQLNSTIADASIWNVTLSLQQLQRLYPLPYFGAQSRDAAQPECEHDVYVQTCNTTSLPYCDYNATALVAAGSCCPTCQPLQFVLPPVNYTECLATNCQSNTTDCSLVACPVLTASIACPATCSAGSTCSTVTGQCTQSIEPIYLSIQSNDTAFEQFAQTANSTELTLLIQGTVQRYCLDPSQTTNCVAAQPYIQQLNVTWADTQNTTLQITLPQQLVSASASSNLAVRRLLQATTTSNSTGSSNASSLVTNSTNDTSSTQQFNTTATAAPVTQSPTTTAAAATATATPLPTTAIPLTVTATPTTIATTPVTTTTTTTTTTATRITTTTAVPVTTIATPTTTMDTSSPTTTTPLTTINPAIYTSSSKSTGLSSIAIDGIIGASVAVVVLIIVIWTIYRLYKRQPHTATERTPLINRQKRQNILHRRWRHSHATGISV